MHRQCIPSALPAHSQCTLALFGPFLMVGVPQWTGRSACALQAALRMTNESFAAHLGTAVRTVATWHQRPDRVPSAEMQMALDTALERADPGAKERFAAALGTTIKAPVLPRESAAHSLRVAVAVVLDGTNVLVVQRRGEDGAGISWQFPAGVVKPGVSPATVAVRETFAETGVHCAVVRELGSRLHPITHVYCDYLLCEYLTGEAHNVDVVENVSVTWAPKDKLTRFIPAQHIFPPILEALEVTE
jgi:8-oxo-dGTP diphosphatase